MCNHCMFLKMENQFKDLHQIINQSLYASAMTENIRRPFSHFLMPSWRERVRARGFVDMLQSKNIALATPAFCNDEDVMDSFLRNKRNCIQI